MAIRPIYFKRREVEKRWMVLLWRHRLSLKVKGDFVCFLKCLLIFCLWATFYNRILVYETVSWSLLENPLLYQQKSAAAGIPCAPILNTLLQEMQCGRHFLILYCQFNIHFILGYLLLSIGMALSAKDGISFILGLLLLWVLIFNIWIL